MFRCFKIKSPESDSLISLYRSHTYRVPRELHGDVFIGFRYLKKSINALNNNKFTVSSKSSILIYDGDERHKLPRLAYMQEVIKNQIFLYITVDNLPGVSMLKAITYLLLFLPIYFVLCLACIFSKNRASIALSILSLAQNYLLLKFVKQKGIKTIYYFFSFENDANFNSYVLMKKGIKVINVPGPNPLQRFHTLTVSSKIALSTGFQFEQAEKMKSKWYVDEILKWPLYGYQEFRNFLNDSSKSIYEYPIGFISSGVWRRIELGLQTLEDDYSSEQELIAWLKEYLSQKQNMKLFVFLHPIEKKNLEVYNSAINYYKNEFKNVLVEISDYITPSYEDFYKVNVTVASHSSTNLQRLYCGYKALYTPMKFKYDLFPNASISNICFMKKQDFFSELDKCNVDSDKQFFDRYNLWNYHFNKVNPNL